jgi:hypothetical protein
MTGVAFGLPARPFFSCNSEGLAIVDAGQARDSFRSRSLEPWMYFKQGLDNVIDTIPRKIVGRDGDVITVECDGGTVVIDFAEGQARKITSEGEFVYLGTLEERNEGLGYLAVS